MKTKEGRYSTMEEYASEDFSFALSFNSKDVYRYYNRFRGSNPLTGDDCNLDVDLLPVDIFPDWYWTTDAKDMTAEQEEELDDCISYAISWYMNEWDSCVDALIREEEEERDAQLDEWKKNNPERTEELYRQYEDEKSTYESNRDSYYGYCMNGGGERKAFRNMYGDGNFDSWDEWLADKVL